MHCGCQLHTEQLIVHDTLLACPVHKKKVHQIKKTCKRCGRTIVIPHDSSKKQYCDDCNKILYQARTVFNYYKLDEFIDPWLQHKIQTDIIIDISINAFLKEDAIQIDLPRGTQFEQKKIQINFDAKIQQLQKKRRLKMKPMVKDCRTCQLLADCRRPKECSTHGDYPYWKGKITGDIIKNKEGRVHVKNHADGLIYIVGRFDRKDQIYFEILQSTPFYDERKIA